MPLVWRTLSRDRFDVVISSSHAFAPHRVARLMDLPCVRARVDTVADEAAIYLLVNGSGTAQTNADLDRARRVADTRKHPPDSAGR
ncbi:hypothetical protein O7627_33395 [Solwaraspora sp. WMMD1047]|uniref:hypothetical protein n=1 Tax=Solwaraspora sp. WMMD1047 TaxID=3016102 RepID=UPI002416A6F3|nr:hypothetical protein [Solwaraspora sp. WMMD1047]MDG4834162.1 hypothetical protein [Solwaraspora sp. WMMD1047]